MCVCVCVCVCVHAWSAHAFMHALGAGVSWLGSDCVMDDITALVCTDRSG